MSDDGYVSTETCSEHLFTGLARRPDDGNIRTETCSELLLTGLIRRPDYNCHVNTEN
jgi:hypothetical protein